MKKTVYLNYLFAHLLLMALGGVLMLLAVRVSAADASPLWALAVVPMAAAACFAGKMLCSAQMSGKDDDFWNAAIVLYVISLILLALLWKVSESGAAQLVNVWNLPMFPALLGFDAWVGDRVLAHGGDGFYALLRSTETYQNLILPVMGAVLAAVEPLCLTLGFLSGTKKTNEENKTNA